MILDYSEYVFLEGRKGTSNRYINSDLFFSIRGICPFCNISIENKPINKMTTDLESPLFRFQGITWESETVWLCNQCGWWEHKHYKESQGDYDEIKMWDLEINSAILKKYEIGDYTVPIESLIKELQNNQQKIEAIHHKKMEEMVQYVFQSHFNCEVKHIGKSHDGGIDLLLINSNSPIAIQVKRRQSLNKIEPVNLIRELIGSTLLAGLKDCIYVTTASKFSFEAEKAREQAIERKLVNTFELFDRKRFFEIMDINTEKISSKWKNLLIMK